MSMEIEWVSGRDVYAHETQANRRSIDGVTHLFRITRNEHYATPRWDVEVVTPKQTYNLRFKSKKAAFDLAETYHPGMLVKNPYSYSETVNVYHAVTLLDGKTHEMFTMHAYQGWETKHRPGNWVDDLLTPLEQAGRNHQIAVEERDKARAALDAAEQRVIDTAVAAAAINALEAVITA